MSISPRGTSESLGWPAAFNGDLAAEQSFELGAVSEAVGEAFGDNGDAVGAAHDTALEDRAFDDVNDARNGRLLGELLGDEAERRAGGLGDSLGEKAGVATHGGDEVPAAGRQGVGHQILDDHRSPVTGGGEAEGVDVAGERKIVVDGLGDVNDADCAFAAFGDEAGTERRVVAADCEKVLDADFLEV